MNEQHYADNIDSLLLHQLSLGPGTTLCTQDLGGSSVDSKLITSTNAYLSFTRHAQNQAHHYHQELTYHR